MEIPLSLLMVEDSEDDTILVLRELRRSGYAPIYKRVDTPEAMRAALADREWDIVIADYSMPRFNGLAALALLQQSGFDLPFIIVSGNIGEEVAVAAMRAGAQDYVMKDKLARLGPAVRRELLEAEVQRARKKAEQSLLESEARYRSLVETSPDAIVSARLDGIMVTANQQAARLIGFQDPEDLIGKSIFAFTLPDDRQQLKRRIRLLPRLKDGRNLEFDLVRQDGSVFPAELSVSIVGDKEDHPLHFIAVARDITERKLAEEALVRSNIELTTLYEAAQAISSNLSLSAVLQAVAEQLTRALNWRRCVLSLWEQEQDYAEVLVDFKVNGSDFSDRVGMTYSLVDYQITRQVLETGEPAIIQIDDPKANEAERALMEDGKVKTLLMLPLVTRDHVLGLVELYNDEKVKERAPEMIRLARSLAAQAAVAIENARLYQETRRQANKLEALLEIGHHISATLDLRRVLRRIATHARDVLDADDSDAYLLEPDGEMLRAVVSIGEYAEQIEAMPLKLGQGIVGSIAKKGVGEIINEVESDPRGVQVPGTPAETHTLLVVPLVFRDQLLGAMALARNAGRKGFIQADLDFMTSLARQAAVAVENARLYNTEQRRTEELARALEQQQELDRLKDQFIQNVSHELRTPVTIIQGYAELLHGGELGELAPSQHQPMDIIARRAFMLRQLVDDLTAILQAEAREMRLIPVDLGQIVQDMIEDFTFQAEQAGLTMVSEVEQDLPELLGDPDNLRRLVDNLMGNAVKFTPRGGNVTVCLGGGEDSLELTVADSGVGIAPDQLERVFERFYQEDGSMTRRYGGTGLGLALVKEIAEAHGGEVALKSVQGQGSTFTITFPAGV